MPDEVVIGLQWGDEGKGKLVDEHAASAAAVVRFQGGANAGHTLRSAGNTQVVHQVPSGALRPDTVCILAAGCAVEPAGLREEVTALGLTPQRLVVSPRAQVVLPWHLALDAAEEQLRGPRAIGTTRRGIGPAYAAKAGRWGLTVGEFVDPEARAAALARVRPWTIRWLAALGLGEAAWPAAAALAAWLRPFVADDLAAIQRARRAGMVLFEGQLGIMRDPDRGAYPFVTGASLLPPAALLGPAARVLGVAKPYITVVGEGTFPTEARPEEASMLRAQGGEYGATTGRPRRVGWLDLPALRYAVSASGATHLAVQMKVAGLAGLERIPVCVRYAGWDEAAGYPQPHMLPTVRPVYEEWPAPVGPEGSLAFAQRMASGCGLPLAYVGTGPERGAFLTPESAETLAFAP